MTLAWPFRALVFLDSVIGSGIPLKPMRYERSYVLELVAGIMGSEGRSLMRSTLIWKRMI
jgi:hypothetical protein